MLAAIAIGGWAIAIATEGAHRQASEAHFSSLWLVPAGAPQTPSAVSVGVTNHEGQATTYHLSVRQGNRARSGGGSSPRRRIRPGRHSCAASAISGTGPVIARLDRDGRRYHRVALRLGGGG